MCDLRDMTSSMAFIILVLGVAILFQANLVRTEESTSELTLFGKDVKGNDWTTSKHKYGIPLLTRSTEVAFPDDFTEDSPSHVFANEIVRSIKHYNKVDDVDCKPELEITNGGIGQHFATLSIKSLTGCAINSTVVFTTERI